MRRLVTRVVGMSVLDGILVVVRHMFDGIGAWAIKGVPHNQVPRSAGGGSTGPAAGFGHPSGTKREVWVPLR